MKFKKTLKFCLSSIDFLIGILTIKLLLETVLTILRKKNPYLWYLYLLKVCQLYIYIHIYN